MPVPRSPPNGAPTARPQNICLGHAQEALRRNGFEPLDPGSQSMIGKARRVHRLDPLRAGAADGVLRRCRGPRPCGSQPAAGFGVPGASELRASATRKTLRRRGVAPTPAWSLRAYPSRATCAPHGPFATGFDDALDDPGRAGEHRLHRAVAAVADPACDAAVHRLVGDEGAIADALDAAPRDDVADQVAHPNSPVLCEGPLKTDGFPLARGGSQRSQRLDIALGHLPLPCRRDHDLHVPGLGAALIGWAAPHRPEPARRRPSASTGSIAGR